MLHTMIVDKKLRGVKAVQTLSRLNRTCQGKTDTFILDFINTQEDIQEAFQPFYQETMLEHEINSDLLYQVQKDLHGYGVYLDNDITAFANEYFKRGKQDSKSMGRMTSILKPVANRYNELNSDERYNFRRQCRNLIKWYGYITQVVRMFDEDLHKEYIFLSYLLKLIPPETSQMINLEDKLQLEYYKLQKTFEGAIILKDETGTYTPATAKSSSTPEGNTPLEEIIKKINERYKGKFTDADIVIVKTLREKLMRDTKLKLSAKTGDPKIFEEKTFPDAFNDLAIKSYLESQEIYDSLFKDKAKYNAVMYALCKVIYREMRMST